MGNGNCQPITRSTRQCRAIQSSPVFMVWDSLEFAARYDHLQQSSERGGQVSADNANASFSASLPMQSDMVLALSVANGFRYPTLSERFFDGNPRGEVQGNQTLAQERSVGGQMS